MSLRGRSLKVDVTEPRVKEQAVSLLELFYDLIYVYAIARMTSIITEGGLTVGAVLRYVVASLLVLQSWTYMTNYVNRFGRDRWYEVGGIVVNMAATVFLSNTISLDWGTTGFAAFNSILVVNLGIVFALYTLRYTEGGNARATALYSMRSLAPALAIYLVVIAFGDLMGPGVALVLNVFAIVAGITLPALIRTEFDTSIIGFPHLVERFELLTIITFGESVTTVAEYFGHFGFSVESMLVFAGIVSLFGTYVMQVHNLMEHHAIQRALRLIFGHFVLVTCVNLYTISLNLALAEGSADMPVRALAAGSLVGFMACVLAMGAYYPRGLSLGTAERNEILGATAIGALVTLSLGWTMAGFLGGAVVVGLGSYLALLRKWKARG